MELPIAPQTYQPTPEALVRAVMRSNLILARMAAEETTLDGATALTDPKRPRVRFVNCAMEVSVPEGFTAASVLDGIDAHFAQRGLRCGALYPASKWPADMTRLIESRGYRPRTMDVHLLASYLPPETVNAALQIIPGRAAMREVRELFQESAAMESGGGAALAAEIADAMMDRLDEPRAEIFLARLDRRPLGVVVLVTLGQIGVIDFVYTAAGARGKGVGTTLLGHAIEHCKRAQFERVILEAPPGCPAVPLYARLGFKPVASFVQYERP